MSAVIAETPTTHYQVGVPSKSQYQQINSLVNAFYGAKEPRNPLWQRHQFIGRHL